MTIKDLIQAYDFDEVMSVVKDMFPGTEKFRKPLQKAYEILEHLPSVSSKKKIVYQLIEDPESGESFMGAQDDCFRSTWDVLLGKTIIREKDIDLTDIEILANSLVNLCFLGKYPKEFEEAHQQLVKG
jgi:hypothetical protein